MCELSRTAGKEFVSAATRMLNDLKITIRSMRELSDQRRGQIIISSVMSVANGKLPGLVSAYRLDYPGIELHVRDGGHGTIIEDVRSGAADFGLSYLDSQPTFHSGFAREGRLYGRVAPQ
jgi:DNA-binding transcriptional LysR family regulator